MLFINRIGFTVITVLTIWSCKLTTDYTGNLSDKECTHRYQFLTTFYKTIIHYFPLYPLEIQNGEEKEKKKKIKMNKKFNLL